MIMMLVCAVHHAVEAACWLAHNTRAQLSEEQPRCLHSQGHCAHCDWSRQRCAVGQETDRGRSSKPKMDGQGVNSMNTIDSYDEADGFPMPPVFLMPQNGSDKRG